MPPKESASEKIHNPYQKQISRLSIAMQSKYQEFLKYQVAIKKSAEHFRQLDRDDENQRKLAVKIDHHIGKLMTFLLEGVIELRHLFELVESNMQELYGRIERETDCEIWGLGDCSNKYEECRQILCRATDFAV